MAATCTPIGTNVAGNYSRENLEVISKEANCEGKIPIEIVIPPEMMTNFELLQEMRSNLRELNFDPVYRPWAWPGSSQAEIDQWVQVLAQFDSQDKVQMWNERNLNVELGGKPNPTPEDDAKIIEQLLIAKAQGKFNAQIGTMPLSTLNDTSNGNMAWKEYWTRFSQSCPSCMAGFNFVSINNYVGTQYTPGSSVQAFISHALEQRQFLASLGVNPNAPIHIAEAGLAPGAYAGNFDQRVQDTIKFANELETYLKQNPNLNIDIKGIRFLLMNDETGEQFMFYKKCDANGACEWVLENYVEYNYNLPGMAGAKQACVVGTSIPPSGILRPKPCDNCSFQVSKPTKTCAQTPTVVQYQNFTCRDVQTCPDNPSKFIAPIEWKPVIFNLNTKGLAADGSEAARIPFVGYKDVCRSDSSQRMQDPKSCITDTTNRSSNVNDYINDYFEGTALFDKRNFDMTNPEDERDLYWEAGVFRKLAPQDIQDMYRIDLISKGLNYKVEGYVNTYGSNKQIISSQLVTSSTNAWATQPHPFDGTSGRFPPKLDLSSCSSQNSSICIEQQTQRYTQLYEQWLATEWGQLWYHIPLFSREDAPGKVILTIEHNPGTINQDATSYKEQIPLSIPHLSRLYESTNALYKLLTPTIKGQPTARLSSTPNPVSYVPKKTPQLLAQAGYSDTLEQNNMQLLAQGSTGSPTQACQGLEMVVSKEASGNYAVHLWNNQPSGCGNFSDTADATAVFYADGIEVGRCNPQFWGGDYICRKDDTNCNESTRTYGYSLGDNQACQGQMPTAADVGNRRLTVQFYVRSGNLSGSPEQGCTQAATCNCKIGDPSCTGQQQPEPVEPCTNGSNINGDCYGNNPISDLKPNDAICCSSKAVVNVKPYIFSADQTADTSDDDMRPCQCINLLPGEEPPRDGIGNINWAAICGHPSNGSSKTYTAKMTRKVEVKVDIPYLKDVYEKTAGPNMSIFNLFRPEGFPEYPDDDGLSNMTYEIESEALTYLSYNGIDDNLTGQKSLKGDLYIPYIGGIHQAKKCISEQVLVPADLQASYNQCSFWGGDSLNPVADMYNGSSCKPITNILPYRNPASQTKEQLLAVGAKRVGEKLGGTVKDSFIANFETVYQGAIAGGWNPAFILALWVEESAASTASDWGFGCKYNGDGSTRVADNLADQFVCLNEKTYKDNGYVEFMLRYSGNWNNTGEKQGQICNNSGFAEKVERYYRSITEDISYNSQM